MSEAPHILRNLAFKQRRLQILRDYLDGETCTSIARRIGISCSRVRGIVRVAVYRHHRWPERHRLPDDIIPKLGNFKLKPIVKRVRP